MQYNAYFCASWFMVWTRAEVGVNLRCGILLSGGASNASLRALVHRGGLDANTRGSAIITIDWVLRWFSQWMKRAEKIAIDVAGYIWPWKTNLSVFNLYHLSKDHFLTAAIMKQTCKFQQLTPGQQLTFLLLVCLLGSGQEVHPWGGKTEGDGRQCFLDGTCHIHQYNPGPLVTSQI